MGLLRRRQAKEEFEVRRDFSDIAQTYGYKPEAELDPEDELILFRNLGLTALRAEERNPDYVFLTETLVERSAARAAQTAA